MLSKLLILPLLFLLVGCTTKEVKLPENPIVFIPVKCEAVVIPSLNSMVTDPSDDVEIAIRILQQSEIKTNGLNKCKGVNDGL